MSSTVVRLSTWDRKNSYVASIAAGKLTDAIRGRALTNADAFSLAARAYQDDDAVDYTPLSGASSVVMTWSADAQQWAGALPYVAESMNSRSSVRVVVTLTPTGGDPETVMDAKVTFTRADGR